jgi:methionine-rich copper-binding protein CopC
MSRRDIIERMRRVVLATLGLVLVVTATARSASYIPYATPHITLDASMPADEDVVDGEVSEVRLFFSEAPLMRGASIRVVNSSRQLIRSSPPEADAEDPRQLAVQIAEGLPGGKYVIQWRCIADDGHVMRGSFTFDVIGR